MMEDIILERSPKERFISRKSTQKTEFLVPVQNTDSPDRGFSWFSSDQIKC
jgi:hypothetical protein